MLRWLMSFLSGKAFEALVNAYKIKLEAAGKQDALAVDLAKKDIESEIAARTAAKEIIIAEQGHWYTAVVRPLFALPFVIFIWKVVVWDKVLGWGVTDRIDPLMADVLKAIIYSYFGLAIADRVSRVFKR